MIRSTRLAAALLFVSTNAFATGGGPNGFEPLGVDDAGKVYLRESVGGETGEYRLWTLDPASPGKPVVKPAEANAKAPVAVKPLAQLPLNEASMTGEIVRQSLFPRDDVLLPRFDLRVTVAWKAARSTVDLVAYKTAQVRLVNLYASPKGSCAIAFVSTLGKPEETGYDLQTPVMLCAKKVEALPPSKMTKPLRTP